MPSNRPTTGQLEERAQPLQVDGRRLRGVIPFSVASRDLGGWTEVIEPTALRGANVDDLTLTVEHAGVPLGRYPGTLQLEERSDGVHWSAEPPRSRADVVEAVQRGDLRSASWRMKVGRDEWRGDVRHIHEIAELRDVAITSQPAYPSAAVELRSTQPPEATVPENETVAPATAPPVVSPAEVTETRSDPTPVEDTPRPAAGSLRVGDRVSTPAPRGLADEFRSRGFPGERAEMPWDEFESRAITWSGSVDLINQDRRTGAPLGADQRYAWPAFSSIGVGADVTSVAVLSQSARSLAAPADMNRPIDAVTPKPETSSTLTINTVPLRQIASVQSGIPNVYLAQAAFNSTIEGDLRLAVNEALDAVVLAAVATADFHDPGASALLVAIRQAMTVIQAAGYSPDTLILRPSDSELLDTLVAAGSGVYVFGPGQPAGSIFGLTRRISKSAPEPIVLDSSAFGKLYSGPVSLAKFEENAGSTNSSLVRMELPAAFGVERVAAAVRISAA
jgi:uncharacterized protein